MKPFLKNLPGRSDEASQALLPSGKQTYKIVVCDYTSFCYLIFFIDGLITCIVRFSSFQTYRSSYCTAVFHISLAGPGP
jgi:hypothetical protein